MLHAFDRDRFAGPKHNPHAVPLDYETQQIQTMHVQFALRIQHYERERYGRPVLSVYHFPVDREGAAPDAGANVRRTTPEAASEGVSP